MSLTVLIAPSGFKELLSVTEVIDAITEGVRRAMPDITILSAPMVDGGEGTTEALVRATSGRMHHTIVTGPTLAPVQSFWGELGGAGPRTAVIETAAATGLALVPRNKRDPARCTSRGVGELILQALDHGAERILIGCGEGGANDGGAGMARALGVRLLDGDGRDLPEGGGSLGQLTWIDLSGLDPRLSSVRIDAAVSLHTMLLGPCGVTRLFGSQKGASRAQAAQLENEMQAWADKVRVVTGHDVATLPGAGTSGGLAAALVAFAGGHLHPGFEIMRQYLQFDDLLRRADLVITAEGSLDGHSPYGKIPCEVARRAQAQDIPTIALAGTIGKGAHHTFDHGIAAFASIVKRPCSLDEALRHSHKLLRRAAEDAMRMMQVGRRLSLD